jgi:hypothetical protein
MPKNANQMNARYGMKEGRLPLPPHVANKKNRTSGLPHHGGAGDDLGQFLHFDEQRPLFFGSQATV